MGTQARSFDVNLYDLGICRDPFEATVELNEEPNGSQYVTVQTSTERWHIDMADVRERRLDLDSIRCDGRLITPGEVPHWLAVALDFAGCELREENGGDDSCPEL